MATPRIPPGPYIVMGVSGCGKSTIASQLALTTQGLFLDADDFHPAANKTKMAAGIPLNDEDRQQWLELLNTTLKTHLLAGTTTFLACSALREKYREILKRDLPGVVFIYLRGTPEEIGARLATRAGHFMPPALLDSQFTTLEEPTDAIAVSINQPPADIVRDVLVALGGVANDA